MKIQQIWLKYNKFDLKYSKPDNKYNTSDWKNNKHDGKYYKGLGAKRAEIGPTSDVDKIFTKMYSQYVLFINKYS